MGGIEVAKVGRPKSANPRCLTIPEVRVTREEYRMFKLKAAQYASDSTAKLIRNAVKAYEIVIEEACQCGTMMKESKGTEQHKFQLGEIEHYITITNIPVYQCPACDLEERNLFLFATLEEIIEEEVDWRVKNRLPLPTEIDFNDLVQAKELTYNT